MSNYTKMDEWDRRELLSNVGNIAHVSDEFLEKLEQLVKDYKHLSTANVGLGEILN